MSTNVATEHLAGMYFARACLACDFCDAKSEEQGACGVGANDLACAAARAHARVSQGWTDTTVAIGSGRKRYSLLKDICPGCSKRP